MSKTLKKVRLDLDALAVDSFSTAGTPRQGRAAGTVFGASFTMTEPESFVTCTQDLQCNKPTNWDYTCFC